MATTSQSLTHRVLHELQNVAWRSGTKKIAIVFGDAPTHDLTFAGYNYGGDPGSDNIAQTADDLDFEETVQALAGGQHHSACGQQRIRQWESALRSEACL